MAVEPFPFATLDELKERWPDFPPGTDDLAEVQLEDASQFILDVCSGAATADPKTRRRIVCAIVRRAMTTSDQIPLGVDSISESAGPFSHSFKASNPNGDFYLTKAEKKALGCGAVKARSVPASGNACSDHLPWCSLNFGANYCSCGVDIAGRPIFEGALP